MNPKSGKAGTPVDPATPKSAQEADQADPGEVEQVKAEQRKTQSGKYGSEKVKPYKPPQTPDEEKTSWIEIEMVDEEDRPVPGMAYRITLPDGTVAEGTLDDKGFARVDGIDSGTCQITFPDLDGEAWSRA
jgi:type VI secretion system secreted protein VgrG